jgi:hypothetical protein
MQLIKYILLSIFLVSCATMEKPVGDDIVLDDKLDDKLSGTLDQTGDYKYDAWRLNLAKEYGAVNPLLKEVDTLIEKHQFNTAIDKLERALRIKPKYAQAWSRLSWLALETNTPKRSMQMAKRSNSFSFSNAKLQVLNWTFIRSASEALDDDATFRKADKKIKTLKAF